MLELPIILIDVDSRFTARFLAFGIVLIVLRADRSNKPLGAKFKLLTNLAKLDEGLRVAGQSASVPNVFWGIYCSLSLEREGVGCKV